MTNSLRLIVVLLTGLGLILGIGGSALIAQSERQSGKSAKTEQQRVLLSARKQADEARQRGAALARQAQSASSQSERAALEAAAMAARIQASEADITAARSRIAIVAAAQQAQRARLAEKQGPIIRLTAALQMMTRKPTAVALVEPRSLDDLIHVRSVMAAILPEIERRTASLRNEVEQGEKLRLQAAKAMVSLADSQKKLAARRQQLARLGAKGRIDDAQFSDSAGFEQEQALALGEEARDILDLMNQIQDGGAVRESLAALDGPVLRPDGSKAPPVKNAPSPDDVAKAYRLPVNGEIVTGLGEFSDSGYRARGLTLAVQPNAQVVAPAAGRVAYAGRYGSYGNILIIEHDQGWTSLITNLGMIDVAVGKQLVQGAPVGTTAANDPKITVELRRHGRPIDIAALLY